MSLLQVTVVLRRSRVDSPEIGHNRVKQRARELRRADGYRALIEVFLYQTARLIRSEEERVVSH